MRPHDTPSPTVEMPRGRAPAGQRYCHDPSSVRRNPASAGRPLASESGLPGNLRTEARRDRHRGARSTGWLSRPGSSGLTVENPARAGFSASSRDDDFPPAFIPASSGKTTRHRLNRGGDRQANSALHMVVVSRMRTDERTKAYVERRLREGLSKKEIMRCLKRYVAREVFRTLVKPSS